jgi:hypothetical protein
MRKYSNRYKLIYNQDTLRQNIYTPTISKRETDVYLTYTESSRLDNISNRIYGYPEYYWVILQANGYSLEFDIEVGEILRVPYPLEAVIEELQSKV